jgi:hypothetical protein
MADTEALECSSHVHSPVRRCAPQQPIEPNVATERQVQVESRDARTASSSRPGRMWLAAYSRVRARQGSGTCGPAVSVQSQSHSGVRSMPTLQTSPRHGTGWSVVNPPSKIPSGSLRRRTVAPHLLHISPSLISCDAFHDAQATPGSVARGGAAPGFSAELSLSAGWLRLIASPDAPARCWPPCAQPWSTGWSSSRLRRSG